MFYDKLKQAVPLDDVLVAMHVGGRYANLRKYFDQELITLVELASCWGVFEWMLWDAFDKGYIVGVMCNSDGHHGRPGAEGSGMTEFGIKNGLTCVLPNALTCDSLFDTLKKRQCYGTTGARILLDFTADGKQMGSVLTADSQRMQSIQFKANVIGTAPLESLQLFCGKEIMPEIRPAAFDELTRSNHIRVSWQGRGFDPFPLAFADRYAPRRRTDALFCEGNSSQWANGVGESDLSRLAWLRGDLRL